MLKSVTTLFSYEGFISSVSGNIDMLANTFYQHLSGFDNAKTASIILILLAIILFIFLIIVLYVKTLISFLKSDGNTSSVRKKRKKQEERESAEKDKERENLLYEEELERELEKELERDLEQARYEKELQEKNKRDDFLRNKEKEAEELKQQKKQEEEKEKKKESSRNNFRMELDWKKGLVNEMEANAAPISQEKLKYHQSNKALSELLGLIIDMIGRGVDDLKIAQTIMYRNQGQSSEDDILQTISAIKTFVKMAVEGRLVEVRRGKQLPDEATALYHLAAGDSTYVLALLEALMDANIEKTTGLTSGPKRDQLFLETSSQACTFGTLAAISDIHLATGAFELSIELAPKNVTAWSRAGDMYSRAGSHNQAIWAYQNVLNMADEELNIAEVANANKMLSQYYYEQGNNLQAAKLYNESKHYYDSLGINRRLDRQEIEIIEIIESRQKEDINATIAKILGMKETAKAL